MSVRVNRLPTAGGRHIGRLVLERETQLNALDLDMIETMLTALQDWQRDDSLVAVVLEGSGDRAFCAGGDVVGLSKAIAAARSGCGERELGLVPGAAARFFEREYRLDYLLHTFGKPVVCVGAGIVMGGGMGLFTAAGQRIVTERSRLAMPEVTIALYPDVGGSWFLNRLPPGLGEFIALTGCSLNAADSLWLGLANRFVAQERLSELWPRLQDENGGPNPVPAVLRELEAESATALAGLDSPLRRHQDLIRKLMDRDNLADKVNAILEVDMHDAWFTRAQQTLAAGSPLAMAVIHRQLAASRHLSLAQVFQSELALSVQLCRFREFAEGVRARLIDKDNRPDWTFSSLEEVDTPLLNTLFTSPWGLSPLADLK
ncbi:enoyl-CoA hydratase/isomerase family protein [Oceanimonas sp. CHS3-5]|uniref:enoyl-CoA hydratase/isomerase family protein n=1 Tax=Oceanimonas sp. CHS3-5 TaxID=3068186 RepID=UPI00273ED662|nr:enoyl-CoA hydratase/isomerase family protein [Oceanimonas sp. CHS3-5]MDP5292190.1 enoyl-CoA hydratase/isomerase family protein [Oceanimonas sp. CHS3-5]